MGFYCLKIFGKEHRTSQCEKQFRNYLKILQKVKFYVKSGYFPLSNLDGK